MSIVKSVIQRKAGQASVQTELNGKPLTSGHLEISGGLRGHSVDHETYPWRVVGHPGGSWSVVGADNKTYSRIGFASLIGLSPAHTAESMDDLACEEAHSLARFLKRHHPSGIASKH